MLKVTVLGGTGFLGRELVEGLRHGLIDGVDSIDLTLASRHKPSPSFLEPSGALRSVRWVEFNKDKTEKLDLGGGDLLVDAAMSSYPTDYGLDLSNVETDKSKIASYSQSITKFKHLVYLSSGAVYGKYSQPVLPAEADSHSRASKERRSMLGIENDVTPL